MMKHSLTGGKIKGAKSWQQILDSENHSPTGRQNPGEGDKIRGAKSGQRISDLENHSQNPGKLNLGNGFGPRKSKHPTKKLWRTLKRKRCFGNKNKFLNKRKKNIKKMKNENMKTKK